MKSKKIFIFLLILLISTLLLCSCSKLFKNTYSVKFDANNGTKENERIQVEEVYPGDPVAQPEIPLKSGYTFLGWYNGETLWDFATPINSNITLTAKWQINTYTANFYFEGVLLQTQNFTVESKPLVPPSVEDKIGYTINWTSYKIKPQNIDVNGSYVLRELKIKYVHLRGSATDNPDVYTYVSSEIQLNAPVPTQELSAKGAVFLGWYLNWSDDEAQPITSLSPQELYLSQSELEKTDYVLVARWSDSTWGDVNYEDYMLMSKDDSNAFYKSFATPKLDEHGQLVLDEKGNPVMSYDAFFAWHNAAYKKYQDDQNREEFGSNKPVELP